MSEEQPSLHIDTDWKKQAQEEKRRLAEEQQKRQQRKPPAAPAAAPGVVAALAASAAPGRPRPRPRRAARCLRSSFATSSSRCSRKPCSTSASSPPSGGEGSVDLDLAKLQIDTLGVLEEKTVNNLERRRRAPARHRPVRNAGAIR